MERRNKPKSSEGVPGKPTIANLKKKVCPGYPRYVHIDNYEHYSTYFATLVLLSLIKRKK